VSGGALRTGDPEGPGLARRDASVGSSREARLRDLAVLVALLALAAILRFPDLGPRGTFDSDQGTDAQVVRTLIRDGVVPLLGPRTSIGDFHHGALYYYLLAPAGIPSGGDDPIALVAFIAALGVAAVGITWWLARSIAGSGAGLVAGLLLAVSATAVEGSTFIWNPNPIPFFAATALAAAWRAATGGRVRWWLVAGAAQAMVGQLHVLGILGLVPLVALWLHALRRTPGDRRSLLLAGLGALAIIGLGYVPLVVHDLGTDFSETRAAIAWLSGAGGSGSGGSGLLARLLFVPLRVLSWPLTGPILGSIAAAVMGVAAWVVAVALATSRARGTERLGLAWLGGSVAVGALLLAVGVRSLAVVTPLPADHYHAFLWPAITAAAGVAAAVLWRAPAGARGGAILAGRAVLVLALGAAVTWNLVTQPPRVAADGGWPAADAAARRVVAATGGGPAALLGVPEYKGTAAAGYPLTVLGAAPVDTTVAKQVVVLCDALFEEVVGLSCRGPAEEARMAEVGISPGALVTSFEAAPGRWISVYEIAGR
jgi:4-amino-4-deoxy-L-arabinose transferase-like glycosyltransferase